MIDYFYLLDYESDKDTGLCMVVTEPAAAADLAIEDVKNTLTRESILTLQNHFPQYDVRKCLDALRQNAFDYLRAYHTLVNRNAKEKKDAEARM